MGGTCGTTRIIVNHWHCTLLISARCETSDEAGGWQVANCAPSPASWQRVHTSGVRRTQLIPPSGSPYIASGAWCDLWQCVSSWCLSECVWCQWLVAIIPVVSRLGPQCWAPVCPLSHQASAGQAEGCSVPAPAWAGAGGGHTGAASQSAELTTCTEVTTSAVILEIQERWQRRGDPGDQGHGGHHRIHPQGGQGLAAGDSRWGEWAWQLRRSDNIVSVFCHINDDTEENNRHKLRAS